MRERLYNFLAYLGLRFLPKLLRIPLAVEATQVGGRTVEWPFVLSNLDLDRPARVLDVGCTDSYNPLPATLAALGHEVHGIDFREFKLKYPNFTFHRGDIRQTAFPDNFFDRVISVSTLEHIGISGAYGSDRDLEGDQKAMREIRRILKKDGKVLITCPYGKATVTAARERIYDRNRLQTLFQGLTVEKEEYYSYNEDGYLERVPEEKAGGLDLKHGISSTAIACFKLVKNQGEGKIE